MTPVPLNPADADELLAAEYALGVLSDQERARASLRVAAEPDFAERVTVWQDRLAPLAERITPVTPPRRVKEMVDLTLFRELPPRLHIGRWLWRGVLVATVGALALALLFLLPGT
ncbi:MAG: hypothetical protein AAGA32_02700 [Pseudomonadota bacterium]